MITAYEFASDHSKNFKFGISPKETARNLRRIADKIESGQWLLQSARVVTAAKHDDFPITFLRMQFFEKTETSPEFKEPPKPPPALQPASEPFRKGG